MANHCGVREQHFLVSAGLYCQVWTDLYCRLPSHRSHFGVPPATASCWILQQLLDASQEGEVPGAAALQLAAAMVPAVDGGSVPHKVLQVHGW